jgi:hypothetical protein
MRESVICASGGEEGDCGDGGEEEEEEDEDEDEDENDFADLKARLVSLRCWGSVPVGLSLYFPSIAAEVAFSWLDLPVTLKATPLGVVSLNSKVVAARW